MRLSITQQIVAVKACADSTRSSTGDDTIPLPIVEWQQPMRQLQGTATKHKSSHPSTTTFTHRRHVCPSRHHHDVTRETAYAVVPRATLQPGGSRCLEDVVRAKVFPGRRLPPATAECSGGRAGRRC